LAVTLRRVDPVDLAFAGVARQAELIRSGEVASPDLVRLYLERIERIDPQINAFVKVFSEQALADAEAAQARRDAGEQAPLLGVPIAVKDNVDVKGEVTGFGSRAFTEPASRRRPASRATPGTPIARPAAQVAARPPPSPRGWSAQRTLPTAPGRSASPPPTAASSASSRSATG
jgi:hypothetical protein